MAKNDLQGTLDLLVLKTLDQNGVLHGVQDCIIRLMKSAERRFQFLMDFLGATQITE